MAELIDLDEDQLLRDAPEILSALLADRTTGRNIVWACDDYGEISPAFTSESQILPTDITGRFVGIIKPRSQKAREAQLKRTKGQAEVFTPSWVCNAQNNLIDTAWFGREGVFNIERSNGWDTNGEQILFDSPGIERSWQAYVAEPRLEITCGEAPYLVSRYDTVTGEPIATDDRIGLLDRKLRVVNENCETDRDWLAWAKRAFQATYGFEYQGDSLLLARENLLLTYQDYRQERFGEPAAGQELQDIADIISWNIWQMDGLTQCTPSSREPEPQDTLFSLEPPQAVLPTPCKLMDWQTGTSIYFSSLLSK